MSTTITPTEQTIDINVTEDVIDINVTNNIVDVNATTEQINIEVAGAYPLPATVYSVFGRVGDVVALNGDYNTSLVTENTNLYFTNARARSAINLTTSGTSGAATYDSGTGVLNVPQYQGGVTSFNTRTGAISLTSADVSGALTYVPYNSSNPSGYLSSVSLTTNVTGTLPIGNGGTGATTASAARTALGLAIGTDVLAFRTFGTAANNNTGDFYLSTNPSGYISGITSGNVITALGYTPVTNARTLTINGTTYDLTADRSWTIATSSGTVTSVGFSAPTGFNVTGSPVTTSGTLALSFASGYSLPTNVKQGNWDDAYTFVAAFPTQTGNAGKYLTTDGSVLSWATNPLGTVTSVAMSVPTGLSVSGSPITSSGTLAVSFASGYSIPTDASQTTWDTAYTNRITSLTTTGSSGSATLISNTLNIPTYTLSGLGGQPALSGTGFVKISGTTISYDNSTYYLASNPSAFIALTALSAGTGISYNNTTGVITNSAPDQTVSLSNGTGISVSGTYPSFTIASTITQYTDALARASLSFAAGSGAYNSTTGVITIPTNTSQLTNGANYITLTSLSGSTGISYNNTTGAISSTITQYTDALARASISLTTTGSSGAATYNSTTGVLNIPQYTGGGGGSISLAAIGSTPNANAATLTGTVLNLEPASASFGGVVTTGTQTFEGTKTFNGIVTGASFIPTSATIPTNGMYLSAANTLNFATNTTNRLTISSSGNLGLGVTPSAWSSATRAFQIQGGSLWSFSSSYIDVHQNDYFDGTNSIYITTAAASIYRQFSGQHQWFNAPSGTAGSNVNFTQAMTLDGNGNLAIGTTTIGSKFQVNGNAAIGYSASTAAPTNGLIVAGTSTFSDNVTISKNGNFVTSLTISNSTSGTGSGAKMYISSNSAAGGAEFGKQSSTSSAYKNFGASDFVCYNGTAGNISFLNDFPSGGFNIVTGGIDIKQFVINSAGSVGFSTNTIGSKVQINGNLAVGYSASTAAPTNGLAVAGDTTIAGVLRTTITTNRQTASYTLVLADRGKLVEMNVATANNLTIPLNSSVAFPIGTQIDLSQYGAGQTTVVATGGVTIRSTNSWVKLNAQYAAATLIKIGTDEWYLFGNLNA